MVRKLAGFLLLVASSLVLGACAVIPVSRETYPPGAPGTPVVEYLPAGSPDVRPIDVTHVDLQVGVGSPIPVDVFVSGSWPDLCAQIAEMTQQMGDFHINITLLATPADPTCPPDFLGLPFRIAIPLNTVEMAEGDYTLTVNGVTTTFTLPVTPPVAEGAVALSWEGHTEFGDGDASTCKTLQLAADNQAWFGLCGGPTTSQPLTAYAQEWAEIQAHFAPFTLATETDKLAFQGAGDVSGAAWERALLAWTHHTYGTLVTGNVSASAKTAMSWWLGEVEGQDGLCRHLTVLVFGYATADVAPCGGGNVESTTGGWLTTDEMTAFDGWLYGRAAVYVDDNYLAGSGTQAASDDELGEIAEWAAGVYTRLMP